MYLKVRRKECVYMCVGGSRSHVCTRVEADVGSILDCLYLGSLRQSGQTACSWDPVSTFRLLGLEASHHSHLAVTWVLRSRTLALEFIKQMVFLLSPSSQPNKRDF